MESQMALYKKSYIHKNPIVSFPPKLCLKFPFESQTDALSLPRFGAGSGFGSETTEDAGELCSRATLAAISWRCHGDMVNVSSVEPVTIFAKGAFGIWN